MQGLGLSREVALSLWTDRCLRYRAALQMVLWACLVACNGDLSSATKRLRSARLGASVSVSATTPGTKVRLSALSHVGQKRIGEVTVALDTPGSDAVTLSLDITDCAAETGGGLCSLNLIGTLLSASDQVLDEAGVGPLTLADKEEKRISQPLVLREVQGLDVSPPNSVIEVGQSVTLTATPRNRYGAPVVRSGTTWTSSNVVVASLFGNGVVTGHASGVVTIGATVAGASGSASVTVRTKPQVLVNPATFTFSANLGETLVRQAVAQVTNGGMSPLLDLVAEVTYAAPPPRSWLTASVSPAAAPSALALSANPSALPLGTYLAIVTVRSTTRPDVPSVPVGVSFTIRQAPTIQLTPPALSFAADAGGPLPASQGVQVANAGSGTLDNLAVFSIVDAATSAPATWLTASLDASVAPAALTVRPATTVLLPGTYTARVDIGSTAQGITNSPQVVTVTYVVAPALRIQVSPATVSFTAGHNSGTPPSQQVSVTSADTRTLTGLTIQSISPSWLTASLSGGATPASLTLTANPAGLSVGSYQAIVTIGSATRPDVPSVAVFVSFTIRQAPTIQLAPTAVTFVADSGGALPTSQHVLVTNVGSGSLDNLSVRSIVDATTGVPISWLTASLGGSSAPTALTVRPVTTDLLPGTYDARIEVGSTAQGITNSPQFVSVRYDVAPVDGIVVTPSSVTFRVAQNGPIPTAQNVAVTSTSARQIGGLTVSARPSWLSATFAGSTTPTQLILQPTQTNLTEGTYVVGLTLTSTARPNTRVGVVTVTYVVGPPPPGADVVVFNDNQPFDALALTNASNVTMVRNLVNYTHSGPRGTATTVQFDCGHASITRDLCGIQWSQFHATVQAQGLTTIDTFTPTGGLTSISPAVKVLILGNPCDFFTLNEVNALKTFASEGGRVVYFGEHAGYYGSCIPIENQLLADLGAVMSNLGSAFDCGSVTLTPASLRPHQITAGMTSVTVGCSSAIALGPNDFPLYYDSANSVVLAGVAAINTMTPSPPPRIVSKPQGSRLRLPKGLVPKSQSGR